MRTGLSVRLPTGGRRAPLSIHASMPLGHRSLHGRSTIGYSESNAVNRLADQFISAGAVELRREMVLQRLSYGLQVVGEGECGGGGQGVAAAGGGDLLGGGGEGDLVGGEVDRVAGGGSDEDLGDAGGLGDQCLDPAFRLQAPPAALAGRGAQRCAFGVEDPGSGLVVQEGAAVVAEGDVLGVGEVAVQRGVFALALAVPVAQEGEYGGEQGVGGGFLVRVVGVGARALLWLVRVSGRSLSAPREVPRYAVLPVTRHRGWSRPRGGAANRHSPAPLGAPQLTRDSSATKFLLTRGDPMNRPPPARSPLCPPERAAGNGEFTLLPFHPVLRAWCHAPARHPSRGHQLD